jgi:hypothetical protein
MKGMIEENKPINITISVEPTIVVAVNIAMTNSFGLSRGINGRLVLIKYLQYSQVRDRVAH